MANVFLQHSLAKAMVYGLYIIPGDIKYAVEMLDKAADYRMVERA